MSKKFTGILPRATPGKGRNSLHSRTTLIAIIITLLWCNESAMSDTCQYWNDKCIERMNEVHFSNDPRIHPYKVLLKRRCEIFAPSNGQKMCENSIESARDLSRETAIKVIKAACFEGCKGKASSHTCQGNCPTP